MARRHVLTAAIFQILRQQGVENKAARCLSEYSIDFPSNLVGRSASVTPTYIESYLSRFFRVTSRILLQHVPLILLFSETFSEGNSREGRHNSLHEGAARGSSDETRPGLVGLDQRPNPFGYPVRGRFVLGCGGPGWPAGYA